MRGIEVTPPKVKEGETIVFALIDHKTKTVVHLTVSETDGPAAYILSFGGNFIKRVERKDHFQ